MVSMEVVLMNTGSLCAPWLEAEMAVIRCGKEVSRMGHMSWRERPWASEIPEDLGEPHTVRFVNAVKPASFGTYAFSYQMKGSPLWREVDTARPRPKRGDVAYVWGRETHETIAVAIGDQLYKVESLESYVAKMARWFLHEE